MKPLWSDNATDVHILQSEPQGSELLEDLSQSHEQYGVWLRLPDSTVNILGSNVMVRVVTTDISDAH